VYHDHPLSSHFLITRTYHKIRNQYYWINQYDSLKNHTRSCSKYAQFNVQRQKKPGLLQLETPLHEVFEILQMNFWKAPICSSGCNYYLLVITDRLSKYVLTRALPSATAKDTAEMLHKDIILKYGCI
jgi:IS30 family transposase